MHCLLAFLLITLGSALPLNDEAAVISHRSDIADSYPWRSDVLPPGVIPLGLRLSDTERKRRVRRDGVDRLMMVAGNMEYTANFTIGTESTGLKSFELVVDTGSSETWVAGPDFKCDYIFQSSCQLGPTYAPGQSFAQAGTMNDEYMSGDTVKGELGTEQVTIGGMSFATTIGVASEGAYDFDKVTSGILGMGGRQLTKIWYPGDTNPSTYDPIFFDMVLQGITAPNFTLSFAEGSGYIGFGTLPPVPTYGPWVQTLMPPAEGDWDTGPIYAGYNITIDAIVSSDLASASCPQDYDGSAGCAPVPREHSLNDWMIVDSGTSGIYLPPAVANAFNGAWYPGVNPILGTIHCNVADYSLIPTLGIKIAGHTFYFDPQTLITKHPNGFCTSAVEASPEQGVYFLGAPFLKNVVAVHDIEAGVMKLRSTNGRQG